MEADGCWPFVMVDSLCFINKRQRSQRKDHMAPNEVNMILLNAGEKQGKEEKRSIKIAYEKCRG